MNRCGRTRRDPRIGLMAQLDALQGQASGGRLTVDGRHRLTVKHPTKVLWPQLGLTTVDVMRYYVRVAPVLLPHVRERPLSFRRFAQGIDGPSQFHQRIKWPTPPGVRTASFTATAYVRASRQNLHQAAGTKLKAIVQFENVATYK